MIDDDFDQENVLFRLFSIQLVWLEVANVAAGIGFSSVCFSEI